MADERGHPGARPAAATIAAASAASSANGFSQITWRPASHASIASDACAAGGAAIVTASTPGSASASASDVHACATPSALGPARRALAVAADERDHVEPRGAQRGHVHARAEAGADDHRAAPRD